MPEVRVFFYLLIDTTVGTNYRGVLLAEPKFTQFQCTMMHNQPGNWSGTLGLQESFATWLFAGPRDDRFNPRFSVKASYDVSPVFSTVPFGSIGVVVTLRDEPVYEGMVLTLAADWNADTLELGGEGSFTGLKRRLITTDEDDVSLTGLTPMGGPDPVKIAHGLINYAATGDGQTLVDITYDEVLGNIGIWPQTTDSSTIQLPDGYTVIGTEYRDVASEIQNLADNGTSGFLWYVKPYFDGDGRVRKSFICNAALSDDFVTAFSPQDLLVAQRRTQIDFSGMANEAWYTDEQGGLGHYVYPGTWEFFGGQVQFQHLGGAGGDALLDEAASSYVRRGSTCENSFILTGGAERPLPHTNPSRFNEIPTPGDALSVAADVPHRVRSWTISTDGSNYTVQLDISDNLVQP